MNIKELVIGQTKQLGNVNSNGNGYGGYCGAHATLEYGDRVLLGTIVNVRRDDVLGVVVADMLHFCGDPWPVTPRLQALNILDRSNSQCVE